MDDIIEIRFAKKSKRGEVFPVYFHEYDKNWECNIWSDDDGNAFFENELIFVEEPKKYKKMYQDFLDRCKK